MASVTSFEGQEYLGKEEMVLTTELKGPSRNCPYPVMRRHPRVHILMYGPIHEDVCDFFARTKKSWLLEVPLTGLAIKKTGFITTRIKFGILCVDFFVAIDAVLFRVAPHGVIPPIK